MKKFTVKDIMDRKPCPDYTEEVVTELWKDKKSLTFKEVCSLDIDTEDRIWIAVRLASKATVVSWANYCADEAQKHADATTTAYWAAAAATNAAAAATATAAAANRKTAKNKELKRLLKKLVEMNIK